ncbi:MAG: LCP family protein [Actinomycetales bacterium]|nr:LCP family protein [Actinomycetales bacterium]
MGFPDLPRRLPLVLDEFVDEREAQQAPRRTGRKILLTFVVLLLVGVGIVGGFGAYLATLVATNVTKEADALPDLGPIDQEGNPVELPEDAGMNILFVGSDTRPGDVGRSDVMVLAHITEARDAVYLTHFPRDLYVEIPGRGKNKINASYAFGGTSLLVETMQNLLGIKIDHVAKTDFEGFQRMTDAVGGVTVYAEEASNRGNIQEGWNDLDGERALMFVRERYELSEGDISRGYRQQAFIKALMMKALSRETITNPVRLAQFVDAATQNLTVDQDLDLNEMRKLAFSMTGIRSGDIQFITAPFSGFGTAPDGGWIEIVDEAAMERLGTAIRTDTMESYEDRKVIP